MKHLFFVVAESPAESDKYLLNMLISKGNIINNNIPEILKNYSNIPGSYDLNDIKITQVIEDEQRPSESEEIVINIHQIVRPTINFKLR